MITFEPMSARLAGGFARPIDTDTLRSAFQQALPVTELGELDSFKLRRGQLDAATETLRIAWLVGIDLSSRATDNMVKANFSISSHRNGESKEKNQA